MPQKLSFLYKNFQILKKKAASLPESPGVYLMKSSDGSVLYVGKAKRLRNRVNQYFSTYGKKYERISKMISQVDDFEYILTQSEFEALVLECNLIKTYSPKYNILLKDDKGFNYIKVTKQDWPKISFSHGKFDDDSYYIGPYLSGMQVREILDVSKKLYQIPQCNKDFSRGFSNPCLYYYIGNCSAPCARKITNVEYNKNIKDCVKFIKNGSKKTLNDLNLLMNEASKNLEFEKAAKIRDKIKSIKKVASNQNVVSIKNSEQDFFSFLTDKKNIAVVVFCFRNKNLFDIKKILINFYDNMAKVRCEFIKNYYNISEFVPKFVTVDGKVEDVKLIEEWLSKKSDKNIRIYQPEKQFEKKIMELCQKNASEHLIDYQTKNNNTNAILNKLSKLLNLGSPPSKIEAYDISNTGGSNNVAGIIVVENGIFAKSKYKKFKIETVHNQDDYASLQEVLHRRFKKNPESFPDLVLVDGGKGHVNIAKNTISELNLKIPVFGMVKNSKHSTECLCTENYKISIKKDFKIFKFIENIQNEVHRFALSYHNNLRNKNMTKTELLNIPSIGKKRAMILLKHFNGNTEKISKASLEELTKIEGMNALSSKNVFEYFRNRS